MKKHISYFLNNGIKGHSNYEFVDVDVYNDNLLFIDPILIDKLESNSGGKMLVNQFNHSLIHFLMHTLKMMILEKRICCRMLESKMEHVLGMVEDIMVREIHTKDY